MDRVVYFRFPMPDSSRSTPASDAKSLIIVLSEKPHSAASSLTR